MFAFALCYRNLKAILNFHLASVFWSRPAFAEAAGHFQALAAFDRWWWATNRLIAVNLVVANLGRPVFGI